MVDQHQDFHDMGKQITSCEYTKDPLSISGYHAMSFVWLVE